MVSKVVKEISKQHAETLTMKTNRNFLNGKQYPYGFITWCWLVCRELNLKDLDHSTAYKQLDLDSWLNYFMNGLSPEQAVKEDNKYQ